MTSARFTCRTLMGPRLVATFRAMFPSCGRPPRRAAPLSCHPTAQALDRNDSRARAGSAGEAELVGPVPPRATAGRTALHWLPDGKRALSAAGLAAQVAAVAVAVVVDAGAVAVGAASRAPGHPHRAAATTDRAPIPGRPGVYALSPAVDAKLLDELCSLSDFLLSHVAELLPGGAHSSSSSQRITISMKLKGGRQPT